MTSSIFGCVINPYSHNLKNGPNVVLTSMHHVHLVPTSLLHALNKNTKEAFGKSANLNSMLRNN